MRRQEPVFGDSLQVSSGAASLAAHDVSLPALPAIMASPPHLGRRTAAGNATGRPAGQQHSAPRQDRFPSQTDQPAMPSAMMGSIGHPPGQMATTARASRTAAA